jgi:hypothetical protein
VIGQDKQKNVGFDSPLQMMENGPLHIGASHAAEGSLKPCQQDLHCEPQCFDWSALSFRYVEQKTITALLLGDGSDQRDLALRRQLQARF